MIARIQSGVSEKGAGNFRHMRPKRPCAEPAVPRSPRGGGFRAGAYAGATSSRSQGPPCGETGRSEAGSVARWRSSGGGLAGFARTESRLQGREPIARQRGWQPVGPAVACRHAVPGFLFPPELPGAQETELDYGEATRPVPSNRRRSLGFRRRASASGGPGRTRTGVNGFAVRWIASLPPGQRYRTTI